MADHVCMFDGCKTLVPAHRWGCDQHWSAIPPEIQDAIRRTWSIDDTDVATAREAYVRTHVWLQGWIRKTFGDEGRREADRGRWERMVQHVRQRDAERAARRAAGTGETSPPPARHLRLVP